MTWHGIHVYGVGYLVGCFVHDGRFFCWIFCPVGSVVLCCGDVVFHSGDVVAYLEKWWLIWRYGGSFGDVVAHLEMWCFIL